MVDKKLNRRVTKQQLEVLSYLKSTRCHPTAETIYINVLKKIPRITLATIYRILNNLYEDNQILRFEINREYRYDGFTKLHSHFICEDTGKIYDVDLKSLKSLSNQLPDNFKTSKVEVIYYGTINR